MATSAFEFRLPALTGAQRAAIIRRMRDGSYFDYVLDEAKGVLRFVCPATNQRDMGRLLRAFCKRYGIEKPRYVRGVLVQTPVAEYLRKGVSPGFAHYVANVVDACIERGVEQAAEKGTQSLRIEAFARDLVLKCADTAVRRSTTRKARVAQLRERVDAHIFRDAFAKWVADPVLKRMQLLRTTRRFALRSLMVRAFEAFYLEYTSESAKLERIHAHFPIAKRRRTHEFPPGHVRTFRDDVMVTQTLLTQLRTVCPRGVEWLLSRFDIGLWTPEAPAHVSADFPARGNAEDLEWGQLRMGRRWWL
jgi:hypothetical protein